MTTADAIQYFALQDKSNSTRVCALNFANGCNVGGGYKTGAMAQEEDLCRRIPCLYTTLINAKRSGLYSFGPCTCARADQPAKYSEVLFTPDLLLARAGEREGFMLLPPERQATVALVHAAAPNLKFAETPEFNDETLLIDTIKNIFLAPRISLPDVRPENCVLIVGAWGCGAFGGDPALIADLFCRVMVNERMGRLYQEVHFAIPLGPEDSNADAFRAVFRKYKLGFKEIGHTFTNG